MLKQGRISRGGQRKLEQYNQYALVEIVVNSKPIYGRPIEFDSQSTTQDCKNALGAYVKPTKLTTTCPDCGAGLIIDVKLSDPPFEKVTYTCQYCNKGEPIQQEDNPFVNPLETGRVMEHELDPLLHDGNKITDDYMTVAERMQKDDFEPKYPLPHLDASSSTIDMGAPQDGTYEQEKATETDLNAILKVEPRTAKKPKKTKKRTVEEADGITPEDETFDADNDLVDK